MFGWLKRRQLNEHKKLLYQNGAATQHLMALFDVNGQTTQVLTMCEFLEENTRIAQSFDGQTPIAYDDLAKLLDINRELRKIDHFIYESAFHFDKTYEPVGGWSHYYDSFS